MGVKSAFPVEIYYATQKSPVNTWKCILLLAFWTERFGIVPTAAQRCSNMQSRRRMYRSKQNVSITGGGRWSELSLLACRLLVVVGLVLPLLFVFGFFLLFWCSLKDFGVRRFFLLAGRRCSLCLCDFLHIFNGHSAAAFLGRGRGFYGGCGVCCTTRLLLLLLFLRFRCRFAIFFVRCLVCWNCNFCLLFLCWNICACVWNILFSVENGSICM